MALHPVTISTSDTSAAKLTGVARHEQSEASSGETKVFLDTLGVVAIVGRGETDPNLTYVAMKNTSGTLVYAYPNAAGNGLQFSTVKP